MSSKQRIVTFDEPSDVKGFKLIVNKDAFVSVQVTKSRAVILRLSGTPEQSLLKEVYDWSPKAQRWIQAPKNYKAPWQP